MATGQPGGSCPRLRRQVIIRPVPTVAAMTSYALADLGGPNTVSLAQNESAFEVSPKAISAAQTVLAQTPLYPDPDWRDLRSAVADVYGLDAASLPCGAGSLELIGCLIHTFAGPGDEVLGSQYGYLFVSTASQQAGATYVQAPEPELTVSVDAIMARVTARTKIMFVCNPGYPTGTRIKTPEILRLRAALPSSALLIVDQAYGEFDDQDPRPIFDLVSGGNTVVLRTFSQGYGLAAARVGWGDFPVKITSEVRKLLNSNNIAATSQVMATASMRDRADMVNIVEKTAIIRGLFADTVRQMGMIVPVSHTNFGLIRFGSVAEARQADAALRIHSLITRAMGGYGFAQCLRATIGAAQIMDQVLGVLSHLKEASDASRS
jgi:histidinol-phosphate aminotransferase